ncbi:MAG: polyprenyl synthetase family protein [Ktedonobacterales bacterium]
MTMAKESVDFTTLFTAQVVERSLVAETLCRRGQQLFADAGLLSETGAYALATPGKLLRPLLLLDACRATGGDPERVFPAALGTEFGHIASLIHDDIIDGDDERRGRPTLHRQFDTGAAILTGDALIFSTFLSYTGCLERGVSAERTVGAIRLLSETCIEMCRGQALEAALQRDLHASKARYLEVIRLKTAVFCRAVTYLGAYLGGADEAQCALLGEYGLRLGMAFQLMDDVLCYADADDANDANDADDSDQHDGQGGDTADTLGKSQLSDLCNQRVTLPIIYAWDAGGPHERRILRDAFTSDEDGGEDDPQRLLETHAAIKRVLRTTGALESTRALVHRYTVQAQRSLDPLPPSDAGMRLTLLAALLASRDH